MIFFSLLRHFPWSKILVLIVLSAWYAFLFIRPIDITVGDLGRHLKNGEIISSFFLSEGFNHPIFKTNYYSYTNTDFPFINHHWGSGLVFYTVKIFFGFLGLQYFALVVSFTTLGIFFYLGYKRADFWPTAAITLFLIPLIGDRRDIRPELFSYLFLGIFWLVLHSYHENIQNKKILFILPCIFLLWVNLHIYFIFGVALLVIYYLDAWITKSKERKKALGLCIGLCFLAGLINPFGFSAYQYPLSISQSIGLPIQEMVPVYRATSTELDPARAITFKVVFWIFWILYLLMIVREPKKFSFVTFGIAFLFSFLGWNMVRNITMFGLFFLPLFSFVIGEYAKIYTKKSFIQRLDPKILLVVSIILIMILTAFIHRYRFPQAWNNFGISSPYEENSAAIFLQKNNISGNIFNDFNSGSYLIYYLYPRIKPFIDQRPEAYPIDFVQKKYSKPRLDPQAWKDLEQEYNFSTIILSQGNTAAPIVQFIVDRLNDPQWAPVIANRYHLIFLRRSALHDTIIVENEIPKEKFIKNNS